MLAGAATEDDGDAGLAWRLGSVVIGPTLAAYAGPPWLPTRLDPVHLTRRVRHDARPPSAPCTAGRPAARARTQPLNTPITMAATYVAGGDLEYGRYGNPTWTALRGGARRPGGRPLPDLRLRASPPCRPCSTWSATAPRSSPRGTPTTARSCSWPTSRPAAGSAPSWSTSPTPTPSSRPATDAALVWLESPTNPAPRGRRHPDDPRPRRTRPAPTSSSTTPSPLPCCRRRSSDDVDLVVHSATKYLAGHSDVLHGRDRHPRRRAVRRAQGPPRPARRHPRHLRGVAGAARPAHPAPARRARPGQRPGARTPPRRAPGASARSATPASAAIVSIVLAAGRDGRRPAHPQDARCGCTPPRSAASSRPSSAGGAGRPSPPTIPDGLVRLSVGIEDVEDLWDDLRRRWTAASAAGDADPIPR